MRAMASFVHPVRILFQHCDPAGIVFYPRYFEMLNQTVEAWFDGGLDAPWSRMVTGEGRGVPLVHVTADFRVPSRLGDRLDVMLDVVRIGRSSVELAMQGRGPEGVRLTASMTLVHMDIAAGTSLPWPDELRERMGAFLETQDAWE